MKIKISETKSIVTVLYIKANSLEEVVNNYNEERYDIALNEALPLSISVKKIAFSKDKGQHGAWRDSISLLSTMRIFSEIKLTTNKMKNNIDEDYKRADESATPWKDNFENLYNDIVKVVTVDGEEMTDGECVDALFSVLKKYRGESDEQTEVKF